MKSLGFIACIFGLAAFAAFAHANDEKFPVPSIPGLELKRGETFDMPNVRSPIAFKFKDGRICTYGGNDFSYYSSDNGKTWEKGPLFSFNKMAIDLGNEILSINGNMVPRPDGKLRPFVWPPKAAFLYVRERKYKPPFAPERLAFSFAYIAAVGVRCTPTNRTALRAAPCPRASV